MLVGDDTRIREIRGRHARLMSAYREAVREGDGVGPWGKAEIVRTVIDSAEAAATRLRTREQGVDDLVEAMEKYAEALKKEDWVEKGRQAVPVASGLGKLLLPAITLGAAGAFVWRFMTVLVTAGDLLGQVFVRMLLTHGVPALMLLGWAYKSWEDYKARQDRKNYEAMLDPRMSNHQSGPPVRTAGTIIAQVLDPAEKDFWDLLGGQRPMRTSEKAAAGVSLGVSLGSLLLAGVVMLIVWGVINGILRALFSIG
jgi:hypothetical protein